MRGLVAKAANIRKLHHPYWLYRQMIENSTNAPKAVFFRVRLQFYDGC